MSGGRRTCRTCWRPKNLASSGEQRRLTFARTASATYGAKGRIFKSAGALPTCPERTEN